MKKLLTFLTLLTLSIGVTWAATRNATIYFGSASGSTNINSSSVTGTDSQGNTWTITTEGTSSFTPNSAYAQVGSGSKPASSITFTTTLSSSVTFTSVSAKFGGFSNTDGSVYLKVGNNSMGGGTLNGSDDVIINSDENVTANGTTLTVEVSNISRGVKCYYISYTYDDGGSTVETVATPTFNPAAGTYTEAQNVTISCATNGATIYYTTDGNDPTTSSTEYTEAIDVSSTTTIKAIAVKSGMNNSAIASATYTINSSGGNTSNAMIMFDDNGTDATNDVTSATLLEYTIEGASYVSSYSDIYKVYKAITGIKFSSSKVNGNLTINLSSIAQQPLSKIIVNAKKYDNDDASLSVDGTSTGSLTADYADYEITCDGTAKTSITLEATNRLYVKYINLVFLEQGDHTITVDDAIENGTVTASRESANANDPVTVTVTPDPGYELSTLTVDGTDVTSSVSNNSYTFNMPAHSVTITATFTLKKNKVSYTIAPANTGEVWLNNGTTYDQALGYSYSTMGTTVEIALAAYAGYDVNSLTITDEGGATVSYTTYNSEWRDGKWVTYYSFVMPATPVNIAATFKSGDIYILGTANDNPWDGNKGVKMTYDANTNTYSANVYFATATNTGKGQFSFASNLSGSDGSWDNIGKRWGAQSQDYDLVTNSSGGNWTDNMNSENDYNRFAVPYGVYEIKVNWGTGLVTATKKDITVTLDKPAGQLETGTTVNVASNLSTLLQSCKNGVSATLAYSTDDGANYTDGNSFVVNETVTAKGKAYYGTIAKESDSYAYTAVTYNTITCTATSDVEGKAGGTVVAKVDGNTVTSALAGETVTLDINNWNGYTLSSVTLNGEALTEGENGYSFVMPNVAANVVANFTVNYYDIVLQNDETLGEVSGLPQNMKAYTGQEVSFSVTALGENEIDKVTYEFNNGNPQTLTATDGTYKFNMPPFEVTIKVTYVEPLQPCTIPFHESWAETEGTGGHNGGTGTGGNNTVVSDNEGWIYWKGGDTFTEFNGFGGDNCIRIGERDANGAATTPNIIVKNGNIYKMEFDAVSWNSETESILLSANGATLYSDEACTTPITSQAISSSWATYTVYVMATSDLMNITWEAADVKKRFWLDNVNIDFFSQPVQPTEATLAQIEVPENAVNVGTKYAIADDYLVAVESRDVTVNNVNYVYVWCKDENNVTNKLEPANENIIDFMKKDSEAQGNRPWDQSNWVVLRFKGDDANSTGLKGHKVTDIVGTYIDATNYMIDVESYTNGEAISYTPNVYCVANFNPDNWGADGVQQPNAADNAPYYFFMTPKVQEVCEITYAEWNGSTFTVPTSSGFAKNTLMLGWEYNVLESGPVSQQAAEAYLNENNVPDEHGNLPVYHFRAVVQNNPSKGAVSGENKVYPMNFKGESNIVTAINTIEVGNGEVKSVKYVNVAGMVSDVPFQGVNIVVTEYTDGSRTTSKMLRK